MKWEGVEPLEKASVLSVSSITLTQLQVGPQMHVLVVHENSLCGDKQLLESKVNID